MRQEDLTCSLTINDCQLHKILAFYFVSVEVLELQFQKLLFDVVPQIDKIYDKNRSHEACYGNIAENGMTHNAINDAH